MTHATFKRRSATALAALVATFAAGAPSTALALSCMAPEMERSLDQIGPGQTVIHGTISVVEPLPPTPRGPRMDDRTEEAVVHISGVDLSTGLDVDQDAALLSTCLGPWCGGIIEGENLLVIADSGQDGYTIKTAPCGGVAFPVESSSQVDDVRASLRGR